MEEEKPTAFEKLAVQAYRIAKRKPVKNVVLSKTGKKISIREGALRELAIKAGAYDKKRKRIKVRWLKKLRTRLESEMEKIKKQEKQKKKKKSKLKSKKWLYLKHLKGMVNLALVFRGWRKVGRRS